MLKGDLERALEVMLQRFERVETRSTGVLPGHVAERLEALPPSEITSVFLEERVEAFRLDQKLEAILSGPQAARTEERLQ